VRVALVPVLALGQLLERVFGRRAGKGPFQRIGVFVPVVVLGDALAETQGVEDDADEEQRAEIAGIKEFLPRQLNEAETVAAIAEAAVASIPDMGKVIAVRKGKYTGQMDFGAVGAIIKARLGLYKDDGWCLFTALGCRVESKPCVIGCRFCRGTRQSTERLQEKFWTESQKSATLKDVNVD
jgi:Yqey-like protein